MKKLIPPLVLAIVLIGFAGCGTVPLNYNNYTIVYSSDNGSLPPPYHRERTLTFSKDATGTVKAEYEIRDYEKSLEKGNVSVSSDKFDELISAALLVGKGEPDSLAGCTGGSSESLKVSEGEKIIIDTSSYNCGNRSTNESLVNFSVESGIYDLLPAAS